MDSGVDVEEKSYEEIDTPEPKLSVEDADELIHHCIQLGTKRMVGRFTYSDFVCILCFNYNRYCWF